MNNTNWILNITFYTKELYHKFALSLSLSLYIYIYIYAHTHIYTHQQDYKPVKKLFCVIKIFIYTPTRL